MRALGWAAVCALAACAAPASSPVKAPPQAAGGTPLGLRNAGFEAPSRPGERCPQGWGCSSHADPGAFSFSVQDGGAAEGGRSLCIERVRKEPWALASQALPARNLRGSRVRLTLAVRIERAEGAGTGPWILVNGPHGSIVHEERTVARTSGWERVAVEAAVPPSAETIEVGATMLGGGRACIDDARLEVIAR